MLWQRTQLGAMVACCFFCSCFTTRSQLRRDAEGFHPAPPIQSVSDSESYASEEIKVELTQMEGRLQEVERSLSGTAAFDVREELQKIKTRLDALEHKEVSIPSKVEPLGLFKKGKDHYEKKEYEGASESFAQYLQLPKNKTSLKLLEEALFLKAESFYHLKKYKKAIVEYSHFSEVYLKSLRMPEVLWKIGICFEFLGMKEDARGFFQELLEKYPGSLQAKKVKKKVK